MKKLYIWPRCEQCNQTKELLAQKGIEYKVVELSPVADTKLKREFGQLLKEVNLEKNNKGTYVFPIFVERNGDGVEKFAQGYKGISALIG